MKYLSTSGVLGLVGEYDSLHPVAEPELGQDAPDVGLHSGLRQVHPPGDLRVGEPLGYFGQNLAFAVREQREP